MLLTWVINGFCPQFFISQENLFAGKVTARNRGVVQSVLTELVQSIVPALLRVHIDDLGHRLQTRLSTPPSVVPVLDSVDTVALIGQFEFECCACIVDFTKVMILDDTTRKSGTLTYSVYQRIELLKNRRRQSNKHERLALQAIIEFLICWLGSLVASVSLSKKMGIPRQAIQLLRTGTRSDVATMLKLASVFYCNGDFDKVDRMLQRVEKRFHRNTLQVVCRCYNHSFKQSLEICHNIYLLKDRKERAKLFAHCVRFSVQEIHCAPPALRHELYRSVRDEAKHKDPKEDDWMDLAVVDCLPYLYFLQFMTYRQLGKRDLQKRSLHNLDRCIREDRGFGHLETAWNLLGQCMELEQGPEAAMVFYRTSLEIRPRNNAANWHVQNLLYQCIKSGRVSTYV